MDPNEKGQDQRETQHENNADTGYRQRTYTKDEVERRLQGQGRELKETQAKLAEMIAMNEERDRKEQEKRGEWENLAGKYKLQNKELGEKLKMYEANESKRLEYVNQDIETHLKSMPEDLQALIPVELDAHPDAKLRHLMKLGSIVKDQKIQVRNSGGGRQGRISREAAEEQQIKHLEDNFFGRGGKK